MYLTDHAGNSIRNDERKFWERKMNKVLGGEENCDIEDIPSYLTPDADRGVIYSDEIIEMKVINLLDRHTYFITWYYYLILLLFVYTLLSTQWNYWNEGKAFRAAT